MIELLKGRISDVDGLREVLEIIATFKEVSSAILEVENDKISGRIGIAWGKYITGALLSEPEEIKGRKALRKLLRTKKGKFRFVDLESEPPVVELRQQLGIDLMRTTMVVPKVDPREASFLWESHETPKEEHDEEDKVIEVPAELEATIPNVDDMLNEIVHRELEAQLLAPPAPADEEPALPIRPDLEVEDPNETGLLPDPRIYDTTSDDDPPEDSWASRAMANLSVKKPPGPISAMLRSVPDPRDESEPQPFLEERDPEQPVIPVGQPMAGDAEMPLPDMSEESEPPFVVPTRQPEIPTVPALDAVFGPTTDSHPAMPSSVMPPSPLGMQNSSGPGWKAMEDPFALKGNLGLFAEPVKPFESEPEIPPPAYDRPVEPYSPQSYANERAEQPTQNKLSTLRAKYATESPPDPAPPVRGAPMLQPSVVADPKFVPQQFVDPTGRLRPQPAHDSGSIGIAIFCVLLFVVSCAGTVVLGPRAWEFITSVLHLS
jgi:hypothetical protein